MTDNTPRILEIARQIAADVTSHEITSLQTPSVAEILGKGLAKTLASHNPDTVLVWDQVESAVLGHVVARELDADLIYAFSVEGSLGHSGELAHGTRTVVVSYDWTELHGLEALIRFAQSQGAAVTGIGSVVAPTADAARLDIPAHSLTGEPDKPDTPKEDHVIDNG
jgi:adenine/guanine phosphoribosyltransferase-like PRPP-binding protein